MFFLPFDVQDHLRLLSTRNRSMDVKLKVERDEEVIEIFTKHWPDGQIMKKYRRESKKKSMVKLGCDDLISMTRW